MDNKEQLNQIPGENNSQNQDEKTSKKENLQVEASQQPEQVQDATPQVSDSETVKPQAEEQVKEEIQKEAEKVEAEILPSQEQIPEEVIPVVQEETTEVVAEAEVSSPEPVVEPTVVEETEVATPEPVVEPTVVEETEVASPEPVVEPEVIAEAEVASPEPVVESEVIAKAEVASPEPAVEAKEETVLDENAVDDDEEVEVEPEVVVDYETLSREELIEKLEELVAEEDVNKIKSKVSTIKVAYLKKTKAEKEAHIDTSLAKEDGDDKEAENKEAETTEGETPAEAPVEPVVEAVVEDVLETKFNELFGVYKQKRAIYLDGLERQKIENLKVKHDILEELKTLIASEETLKKTYDDFRELQEKWKSIGMVPKGDVNDLWQNYHFLVEKFFDKVKINKELKDLDLKKNLEHKIDLCEKAEELLLENSIIKSFKELQRFHELWKEIGPVPVDKNEDIWERFKSTTDKINQRRRDHYKKLQDQHDNNYEAKVALCEKAEQLLATEVDSIREWQNKTKQFNELFLVWKSIGSAAKKQNDEIWEKFKAILDSFFNEKKDYFGKLKEQQINNYNLKLDLCVRAEAIKDSIDWRQSSRELINMQKEWKSVGPVPRKHSDKIWKRFRAACDEFFNRKSEHFATIREDETVNMQKKDELIKLVEECPFDGDKNENLNKLKEFQRQWTDIGFVPFKDKDRLQNSFRSAVNKQLDRLNISSSEISMTSYKSKMEVMKGSADGNRGITRERIFIQNKISKLSDDINIWENNIGFLADTKKASLFKDEFEKKINKAKSELEVLEAKLKFLNE